MDYSDYFILLIIIIAVYYFFRKEKDTNTKNSSSIDEKSIEELYPNMSYGQIMSILSDKDESEMTDSEVFFYFGMTMYNEGVDGRSKAIEQLLNNNYTILEDEFGNQYKEVINFVLRYFEDNTEEVDTELARPFPIMHTYIHRHLSREENDIEIEDNFNAEKAYNEFLYFCKNYFLTVYPNKIERDSQIHLYFKKTAHGLIEFFDREEEVD